MKIVRQRRSNMIENRAEYTNRIAPQPANFRELKNNSTPRYHGNTLRVHVGGRKLQVRRFIFWSKYVLLYNVLLYSQSDKGPGYFTLLKARRIYTLPQWVKIVFYYIDIDDILDFLGCVKIISSHAKI